MEHIAGDVGANFMANFSMDTQSAKTGHRRTLFQLKDQFPSISLTVSRANNSTRRKSLSLLKKKQANDLRFGVWNQCRQSVESVPKSTFTKPTISDILYSIISLCNTVETNRNSFIILKLYFHRMK
jgi:hypothetical protein